MTWPKDRVAWTALLLFLGISLPIACLGTGERSGFLQMTRPTEPIHAENSSLGYVYLMGAKPFFRENVSFASQVELLLGMTEPLGHPPGVTFYVKRPFYAFLVSLLSPLMGTPRSLLIVNYLAWCLSAWVAWRFSISLFEDRLVGLFSVLLVGGASGFVMHIGDYSAHLLSFAVYYLGVLVLYDSRVWICRRGLRTHLLIGVYLAIAWLVYNSGVLLSVAYLILCVGRSRLWHLACGAVIAPIGSYCWSAVLTRHGLTYVDLEHEYFFRALEKWIDILSTGWADAAASVVGILVEFATFDSPILTLIGLVAFFSLSRAARLSIFGIVLSTIPLAAAMVYATSAGARGYLVFQISIFSLSGAAAIFARAIRTSRRWLKPIVLAGVAVLLASHFLWSTAHFWAETGPVKMYFLGYDQGLPVLRAPRPLVMSLTAREPTPVVLGGSQSLEDSGAFVHRGQVAVSSESVAIWRSISMRALFVALLVLVCVLAAPQSWRLVGAASIIVVFFGLTLLTKARPPNSLRVTTGTVAGPGQNESLVYSAQLSGPFVNALRSAYEDGDRLWFVFPQAGDIACQVTAGEQDNVLVKRVRAGIWQAAEPNVAIGQLGESMKVTFRLSGEPIQFFGWQRAGLIGRDVAVTHGDRRDAVSPLLPSCEIRLLRPDDTLKVVGF